MAMTDDDQIEAFLDSREVPPKLRGPIEVAREMWRKCWPGMELDGSADLIVLALDRMGYIRARRRQPPPGRVSDDKEDNR